MCDVGPRRDALCAVSASAAQGGFPGAGRWFRPLYLATLALCGCPEVQIKKAELALGPMRFDTATDRSVQGSLRVARQDLEAWVYSVPNVMDVDALKVSRWLNERPTTVYGKCLWPEKAMLEAVAAL